MSTTPKPYINGHYAPVADEHTATALRVRGTLPPELSGRYFRNGHNPRPGVTPTHWFRGSGMIHGLRLRDGQAEWYRNRWVRTPAFEHDAPLMREDGSIDLTASVAGTHIIEHAGSWPSRRPTCRSRSPPSSTPSGRTTSAGSSPRR
ncbi:hypothetical protein GCM10029978_006380 [Actinoallomurus acanthiterrae]